MQQEKEITLETEAIVETGLENSTLPPTPPSRADIILKIICESEALKLYRREIRAGIRRPSKTLNSILYITQIILQAYKTALYAMKENNINITQFANIDISAQVNELIKISRECQDCKSKLQASDTT